jgi:phosphate-selective porin OprO/OprP
MRGNPPQPGKMGMKRKNGRRRWGFYLLVPAVVYLFFSGLAAAEGKSTVEEILDILKNRGIITNEEHTDLLNRAKAEAEEKEPPGTLRAYYKDGVTLETKDKAFKIKMGGRLNVDWGNIDADDDTEEFFDNDFGHGAEFRRARLYMSGTLYDRIEFKSEFDFAGGDVDFNDVWMGIMDIPYIGRIRVGHMKEPFSLEYITSGKVITFMERGLPNALVPQRNTGLTFLNQELDDRLTWAVGFFRETDSFGDGFGDADEYNLTARLTGVPWCMDDGRRLLHLGFSYSHKFRDEGDGTTIDYRSQPESSLSPVFFVDTGDFLVDGVDLINPELALVYGPFSIQAEYMHAFADGAGDNADFWGFYVFGSYFLTGEHRPYAKGAFQRVRPNCNFLEDGGLGAWEIALRYSYLDLADNGLGEVDGEEGKLGDVTFGLNWYLYPTLKLMLNYIYADLDDVGDTHIFQSRFHLEF